MRKLLFLTVLCLGFVFLALAYQAKKTESTFPLEDLPLETTSEPVQNPKVMALIDQINHRNAKIQNIYIRQMPIWLRVNGLSFRARGELAHQKPKQFRLFITTAVTGKEMDIGSNNDIFWFWSKRMNPPHLYFSRHENIAKTNLKTPLNPDWLIESLNVGQIDKTTIASTMEKDGLYYLTQRRSSAAGEPLHLITIFDPAKCLIVGRCLANLKRQAIVTNSYTERSMKTVWHEENITMDWDVSGITINCNLPNRLWAMPDYRNKFDMGKEQ